MHIVYTALVHVICKVLLIISHVFLPFCPLTFTPKSVPSLMAINDCLLTNLILLNVTILQTAS